MKALFAIFIVYTLVYCSFIIYSFYNVALIETKRTKATKNTKTTHFEAKVFPTYYEDDRHKEWPFAITKNYDDSVVRFWKYPEILRNMSRNGHGEKGAPFIPSDDMKELMDQLYKEHNFNLLASDMISLHRSLPDPRYDECKQLSYPEKLPTTSVIIIFHNEAWTTILRTVWSVLERSPPELIEEIILVDDASTWTFLKRPLQDYIETIPFRVELIRTSKREGLIRARLLGAQHAKGNVLTFFDAHVEVCEGWLQPILARIAYDRSVVAVPLIDLVSPFDLRYYVDTGSGTTINGFIWTLLFKESPIPERERIRTRNDKTAPVRTPTIIGCAVSIDREFFYEIGSYDDGMDIWGSENLEMSLRVWQCGGSMETIPCSHVGHLYRGSTYSFEGDEAEIKLRNNLRLVEVWMSEFKELHYAVFPKSKYISAGNLSERIELKKRLKCKSFRWFLENVYPESTMNYEFVDIGVIQSIATMKCMDVVNGEVDWPLKIYYCHGLGGNQVFGLTKNHIIVTSQGFCLGVDNHKNSVASVDCIDHESQLWKYDNETKWLVHTSSGLCMQASEEDVILGKCDQADENFSWNIISSL